MYKVFVNMNWKSSNLPILCSSYFVSDSTLYRPFTFHFSSSRTNSTKKIRTEKNKLSQDLNIEMRNGDEKKMAYFEFRRMSPKLVQRACDLALFSVKMFRGQKQKGKATYFANIKQ